MSEGNGGRVAGKVAVVSGASSGVGRASFELLGREGAKVVGTARREELLNEALGAVEAAGGEGIVVPADLEDEGTAAYKQLLRSLRLFLKDGKTRPIVDASLGMANVLFLTLLLQDLEEGTDVTVLAYGAMAAVSLDAAREAEARGWSLEVLDLRTLVPLDVEGLVSAVAKTGRCVVVHEAPLTAGFGAEVVATLVEEAFYDLDAPVARVASFDVPYPSGALEQWYLPSVDRVVAAAKKTVAA